MKLKLFISHMLIVASLFPSLANAVEESYADSFLGSPLLILTAVVIVDLAALAWRRRSAILRRRRH